MTTVAYCAVSPGGRTEGGQIWMRPEAVPGLRRLTDAIHAEGAAISAQIGHAGPVADARSQQGQGAGAGAVLQPAVDEVRQEGARTTTSTAVIAAHADAARFAIDSGFDAVEIHLGHNYFASSFLSPLINRRADEFGGSLREPREGGARDGAGGAPRGRQRAPRSR